ELTQQFDILVMDAFSGDSVPAHLLTREAFELYFRHLKADGILAVNTTNSYLNLDPVMERGASSVGKVAYAYEYEAAPGDEVCFSCNGALIMDKGTFAATPELQSRAKPLQPVPNFRAWTDDFSNLLSILR